MINLSSILSILYNKTVKNKLPYQRTVRKLGVNERMYSFFPLIKVYKTILIKLFGYYQRKNMSESIDHNIIVFI